MLTYDYLRNVKIIISNLDSVNDVQICIPIQLKEKQGLLLKIIIRIYIQA